tara:strand:+ start:260 stop:1321 length:1062 start_codon:yes stop_codon:yes gene_type:complete
MDKREIRIKTIVIVIKQLYSIQNKKLKVEQKVLNVRNMIKDDNFIKEMNLKPKQIDNIIMNIVKEKPKVKMVKKKIKVKTPVRKIKKKSRNNLIIEKNTSINKLINKMRRNDNENNRNVLRETIKYKLNKNNYKELDNIYVIYFDSVKSNNISLLNVLIDSDIDINATDNDGNTALHHAVYYKRLNVIMILLQNDINSSKTNNQGYKAVDLISKNMLYDIKGSNKEDMLNMIEYRKNKTFKINTSVSLFGKHENLININNEKELTKLNKHRGILIFYMVKCGWCKKMQNDINMLCKRGTKVYIMESSYININVRKKYEINGFPTIFILRDGKYERYNYNDRSYETFEKILNKK